MNHRTRLMMIALASLLTLGGTAIAGQSTSLPVAPGARMDPELVSQLAGAAADSRLLVFVHAATIGAARQGVLGSGMELVNSFDKVSVAVGAGTPGQIRSAAIAPGVEYLEADRPIAFTMTSSHRATRGQTALDGFTVSGTESEGVDGSGVSIAIVDSGIDGTHPMFMSGGVSKVVRNLKLACHSVLVACTGPQGDANDTAFVDLTTVNDTDTPSTGGHGTHVAAIAAGYAVTTSDGRELHGAAPGAKLVGLSVGQSLSVYGGNAGLNWVLEHYAEPCGEGVDPVACPPIKAVNGSFGPLGGGEYSANSTESKLQDALVAAGVVVARAAGNDGGDGTSNSVNPAAQSPTPGVLGVANYDDNDNGTRDNQLDSSSSRGDSARPATFPDISAPGASILAACRPYLTVCLSGDQDPNYGTISGTSMAAPHIAGVAAQLLDANPALTPADIEDVLEDNAHQFQNGVPYEDDPRNADHQSSYDKGHGLVDVAASVAEVRGMAPPAGADCTADGPVVVDAPGDATAILIDTPTESEDSLDVLEGRLGWEAASSAVTFTIEVEDLTADNPSASGGVHFDYEFNYGGREYYVTMSRDDEIGERFLLGRFNPGRQTLATLTGEFDEAGDEIRALLTNADIDEANAAQGLSIAQLEDGRLFHGFVITSRRVISVQGRGLVPNADTATGVCPYTLGLGAVPAEIPEPGPDGSITLDSPTYEWDGEPTTEIAFFYGCEGLFGLTLAEPCDVEMIDVTVPAGSTTTVLGVTVTADNPEVNDFDFDIIDPDGVRIGGSEKSGTLGEHDLVPVTKSGVYRIVTSAFLTLEATYHGIAHLSTATTEEPPEPPFDGEVSIGSGYAWEGQVIPQPVFYCQGIAQPLCDNEFIRVTVPVGGATLRIEVIADFADLELMSVQIYDPSGERIGEANFVSGTVEVTADVTVTGVYRVGVSSTLLVEHYTGSASLE